MTLLANAKIVPSATNNDIEVLAAERGSRVRGRPRDPAKREALLQAARALFLCDGVDGVTMDQIVATSGVARATLYYYFQDKAAILEAVIARESMRIVSDDWVSIGLSAGTHPALLDFGQRLVAFLADPEMLDCERLIAHVAKTNPEHSHRFYVAGPGRALSILTRLIEGGQEAGDIKSCDPKRAASDLMGLWQGFWRTEMVFAERSTLAAEEIEEIAAHGVEQFLFLYRQDHSRSY